MNQPKLPRCVRKYELREYFDCSYDYLWSNLLTDELFLNWGYNLEDIKRRRQFGPELTRRIYIHFGITDLNANLSEEVRTAINAKPCRL